MNRSVGNRRGYRIECKSRRLIRFNRSNNGIRRCSVSATGYEQGETQRPDGAQSLSDHSLPRQRGRKSNSACTWRSHRSPRSPVDCGGSTRRAHCARASAPRASGDPDRRPARLRRLPARRAPAVHRRPGRPLSARRSPRLKLDRAPSASGQCRRQRRQGASPPAPTPIGVLAMTNLHNRVIAWIGEPVAQLAVVHGA